MSQAVAAANGEPNTSKAREKDRNAQADTLEARLALKLKAYRKYRGAVRFFESHRTLLASATHRSDARRALKRARRGVARAAKEARYYRALIRRRDARLQARQLAGAPPRVAICGVFKRYCRQAVSVAWCESRLSTNAQNGQYLGLFQMGSSERRIFGHGSTAHAQAVAAHKYFVRSGRDWSPWSCRWAAS
jgi:hypothetical protein